MVAHMSHYRLDGSAYHSSSTGILVIIDWMVAHTRRAMCTHLRLDVHAGMYVDLFLETLYRHVHTEARLDDSAY